AIPKRSTTILTNSRNRPWTLDGFSSSFNKAKINAGLTSRDLHFHDLRGTAATRFYVAGLPERVIAEIMGWGGARGPDHSAVRGSVRNNEENYSAPQRKENITCKTDSKTTEGKLG